MVRQINFLGLGFEVGQVMTGLSKSPQYAKKYFSLLREFDLQFRDCGNISYSNLGKVNKLYSNRDLDAFNWHPYKDAFSVVRKFLQQERLLINWGGDHSVGISTVGGFCREYSNGYVLWIDAHADLNLPLSSLTGNLHGMPLAILMNLAEIKKKNFQWLGGVLDPSKLIYIGLRDLDPFETEMIKQYGITNYDIADVKKRGMTAIAEEVAKLIGKNPFHVSFDIDSMDPVFAPATGICAADGLTPTDLEILGKHFLASENLKSIDVVEINPSIGTPSQVEQTYFNAFSFLKNLQQSFNKGVSYDAVSRSNQVKHQTKMESCLQF